MVGPEQDGPALAAQIGPPRTVEYGAVGRGQAGRRQIQRRDNLGGRRVGGGEGRHGRLLLLRLGGLLLLLLLLLYGRRHHGAQRVTQPA